MTPRLPHEQGWPSFLFHRFNKHTCRRLASRSRRTNVLLGLIVLLFALSWMPFNINMLVTVFAREDDDSDGR